MEHIMNYILGSRPQNFLLVIVIIGITILPIKPTTAQEIFSNEELFEKGYDAFLADDFMEAALYLFAYVQKNPSRMRTDQTHKEQVYQALNWARGDRSNDAGVKGDSVAKPKPRLDNVYKEQKTVASLKRGVYTIQQKSNGRYVDAHENINDNSVVTRDWQKNDTQRWLLIPMGNGIYTIQQVSSNRYMDAHEGSNDNSVVTRDRQNNDTQRWVLYFVSSNTYTIQQKSNNQYLDAHEGSNDNSLVTRDQQKNSTQHWVIRPV